MTLDQLKPGEKGIVQKIEMLPQHIISLTRLGLTPGTEILCRRRSPLGGPTVYRFRETDVALRKKTASRIRIIMGREE